MKRNRKTTKRMSVMAKNVTCILSLVIVLFVVVILNYLAESSCSHLVSAKCKKERELARVEIEYKQALERWHATVTTDRLNETLRLHGLSMKPARSDQMIHMQANGQPVPGQSSVARLRSLDLGCAAQYKRRRR